MLDDYRNIVNKLSYYLSITQGMYKARGASRIHTVPGDEPRSLVIIGNGTKNGIIFKKCMEI